MQQKKQLKENRQGTSHLALSDYQRKQVNEFEDMSHEFRRLFSELLGTLFLVLVAPATARISGSMCGPKFCSIGSARTSGISSAA